MQPSSPIRCWRSVASLAAAAAITSGACTNGGDTPSPDRRPLATPVRASYRMAGIPLGAGDSLPLDGATSVALAGDLLGILHPGEGRVILLNLNDRTVRLIGRSGDAPSDVPRRSALPARLALTPNGLLGILDANTHTIRVWDTAGRVRWYRRIGTEAWSPAGGILRGGMGLWLAGFGIDSTGRAYVPLGDRRGIVVHLSAMRVGPESGDSALSPLMDSDGLIELDLRDGRTGVYNVGPDYVRWRGDVHWAVDPSGLVFVGRGDTLHVDTLRTGGGRGSWLRRGEAADRDVPVRELASALEGNSVGGRAITPEDVMPVRYAVLRGIFVTPRHVWIGLAKGPLGRAYDVIDRETGTTRRVLLGGLPAAVSERWVVAWVAGPDGEAWLDIVDLEAPTPADSRRPPLLPLEPARPPARVPPPNAQAAGRDSPVPARAGAAARAARAPTFAGIRCSTAGQPRSEPQVTVVLDPDATAESVLLVRLTSPDASGRSRATLGVDGGASASCEGPGEIRFTVKGETPGRLSLTVASLRATVTVHRGEERLAQSVVSDSNPVSIPLRKRR